MSRGRLVLGVGIGDDPDEFRSLGLAFPTPRERQQRLEETVQIIRGLWAEPPLTFHGTHWQLEGANIRPAPVQQPRVPILIAGGGERVTLRQVAQYADMSNFAGHEWAGSAFTDADVRRKFDALRRHCDAVGRPFQSVIRSHVALTVIVRETTDEVASALVALTPEYREWAKSTIVAGTVREVIAYYRGIVAAGAQYLIAGFLGLGADQTTVR